MTARAYAVCCAIVLGTGCRSAPQLHPVVGAPSHGLSGTQARIDLLARQFLPRTESAPVGFAGYCYLVFADRASTSAQARKAAAQAYLGLFGDVLEAAHSVPAERLAVILAPVRTRDDAVRLARKPNLEAFLGAYDHDRADLLAAAFARASRRLPSVSILFHPTPLEGAAAPTLDQAWVIDLTDPTKAETTFLEFRNALIVGASAPATSGSPRALQVLLWVFDHLGYAAKNLPEST